jgi:hypothetical protein
MKMKNVVNKRHGRNYWMIHIIFWAVTETVDSRHRVDHATTISIALDCFFLCVSTHRTEQWVLHLQERNPITKMFINFTCSIGINFYLTNCVLWGVRNLNCCWLENMHVDAKNCRQFELGPRKSFHQLSQDRVSKASDSHENDDTLFRMPVACCLQPEDPVLRHKCHRINCESQVLEILMMV